MLTFIFSTFAWSVYVATLLPLAKRGWDPKFVFGAFRYLPYVLTVYFRYLGDLTGRMAGVDLARVVFRE